MPATALIIARMACNAASVPAVIIAPCAQSSLGSRVSSTFSAVYWAYAGLLKDAPKSTDLGPSGTRVHKCYLCHNVHYTNLCTSYLTLEERKRRIRERDVCDRCLAHRHDPSECTFRMPCYYCRADHHTALCPHQPWIGGTSDDTTLKSSEGSVVQCLDNVKQELVASPKSEELDATPPAVEVKLMSIGVL